MVSLFTCRTPCHNPCQLSGIHTNDLHDASTFSQRVSAHHTSVCSVASRGQWLFFDRQLRLQINLPA